MRCPSCACVNDKVVDTRVSRDGDAIRRRRECLECGERFTTYEGILRNDRMVVKHDGRREEFNLDKLRLGITRACWKRPVAQADIDETVKRVCASLESMAGPELSSQMIGETVMQALRELDEVAFVRFASVYRRFKDVDEFVSEVRRLSDAQPEAKDGA